MNLNNFFLKNIQTFASEMQIMYELQIACAGRTDGISFMVQYAVNNNKPAHLLISTIKDMAKANPLAIADVIGQGLTTKILNHVV